MAKFSDVNFNDPEATFRVSYSGGKDSTAMLLMLLEKGYPVTSVDFLDSEWEYPEVYSFLDKVDAYIKPYGKKINRLYLKNDWKFESWFYGKYKYGKNEGQIRGFPRVLGAGCYLSRQKGRTLDRYDRSSYRYIGIGWNEKHRESHNPRLLYPLIEWEVTEKECIEYLKEKNLYPDHNKYYTRNGCWWCPQQSKKSAYSLYIRHPDLWAQLKEMEKISPFGWNLRARTTDAYEEKVYKDYISGKINLDEILDDSTEKEKAETAQRIIQNHKEDT